MQLHCAPYGDNRRKGAAVRLIDADVLLMKIRELKHANEPSRYKMYIQQDMAEQRYYAFEQAEREIREAMEVRDGKYVIR